MGRGFTFESDEAGRSVFTEGGASSAGPQGLALAGAGPGKEGRWVRPQPLEEGGTGPCLVPRPSQSLIHSTNILLSVMTAAIS